MFLKVRRINFLILSIDEVGEMVGFDFGGDDLVVEEVGIFF